MNGPSPSGARAAEPYSAAALSYGPSGYDVNDPDPWKNGQARMPEGWHVDGVDRGQLWAYRRGHGSDRVNNDWFVISRTGGTFQERMDALVAAVWERAR